MAEAFVTPHLWTWARQRRGLEVEDLAKKLNVKPDAINAWEAGERRPTFRQAQTFAQASYVPFGYLYLADPPVQELPLPDFRTIPGQPPREPSLDLLALMSDVLGKQQWFREYRESEGIEELPFVGSFGPTDPVEEESQTPAAHQLLLLRFYTTYEDPDPEHRGRMVDWLVLYAGKYKYSDAEHRMDEDEQEEFRREIITASNTFITGPTN